MAKYFFSLEHIFEFAKTNNQIYINAAPFPHVIVDNLFPNEILDQILKEFPTPEQAANWRTFNNPGTEKDKMITTIETQLGDFTKAFVFDLNSSAFISFLEQLTGIQGLIPDPHLWGGGLHQIKTGGYLGIHADFNFHDRLKVDRRLNLLTYLNKDWKEEYGGHLELWDKSMEKCVKKTLPVFNRTVIFSTTSNSYHGHPNPLKCPDDITRKSLAMYYYSNGRPAVEKEEGHSTLFQKRKGIKDPD